MDNSLLIQGQQPAPNRYDHVRRELEMKGTRGFGEMLEGVLLQQMLQQMNKSMLSDGLFGSSEQGKVWQGLFTEKLASQISGSGGIGLAEIIENNMRLGSAAQAGPENGDIREKSIQQKEKYFPLKQNTIEVLKQRSISTEKGTKL
ncbi:MAG: rod-binding protein [Candidatus Marinimicrobia bacterium]|nr:rod-binding protein [Candidatus Neomarinimicrobiota bacterium]MCF7880535.1 rod-binding protein [Candidatus Neomarinimicrobiota bacterium]